MNPDEGRCPCDENLIRYLDASLTDPGLAWVGAHLNDCEPCQRRATELQALPSALRQALSEGARMRPPDVPGYDYKVGPNDWPLELGRGGLGIVYRAWRLSDGEPVAIKFLYYWGADAYARFAREVGASLESKHPGIVRAFTFGTAAGLRYYVMEYVEGANLRKCLDGEPLRTADPGRWAAEVAGWLAGLADAIQHAHANGHLHRDLKPSNVLVELKGGRPVAMKITDFGLARRVDTPRVLTAYGQTLGTTPYAPPEQLDGRGEVGRPADVYGLGGVLYAMLTGRPPFDPALPHAPLCEVVRGVNPVPPSRHNPRVPRDLETICLKCLRKDPTARYSTAAELAEDLRRFIAGKRPRARRQTWLDRGKWWVRHNPRPARAFLVIGLLLLLCVGLLGVAVHYFVEERARKEEARIHEAAAKDNAAKAEDAALRRLLDAADFALTRGQLPEARARFGEALRVAPADRRAALEVKRLRCLFAFGYWDELQTELGRLSARAGLPADLRAQVLLHGGDVALWEAAPAKQAAARDLIRAALAVPDGLGAADAAYARGLLDDSVFEAVRHFEEALRHDQFHLRANASLLMELVLSGQLEKGARRAEVMAAAFPGEPVTPLALALIATLREDGPARALHLAELRRVVADPARMAGIDAVFAALDAAIAADHRRHGPNKAPDWLRLLIPGPPVPLAAPHGAVQRVQNGVNGLGGGGIPQVVGIGLPVMGRPARMVEELTRAHKALGGGDAAGAAAILDEAERRYPEALILLTHAGARAQLAAGLANRGDMAGSLREGRRAYELAGRAATAPTLLPFGPYRRNADWMCAFIEIAWRAQARWDGAQMAAAALAPGAAGALTAAVVKAAGRDDLAKYPVPKDPGRLPRLVADGGAYDEARSDVLPQLLRYLTDDDARLVLRLWARSAPEDPQPVRLLAAFELERGNFGAALSWAERGLAASPRDDELLRVRDQARKAIRAPR